MAKALVTVHLGRHFTKFGHYDYKVLLDMGYEVHIAANFNERIDKFQDKNVIMHQIDFDRNPLSIKNLKARKQLKELFEEHFFDLIHTQSPSGGVVTRLAAKKTRKKGTKILYTAHGFHFFKNAPLLNWVIYYPVEKILSCFTDEIITINHEDYLLAKKKMKSSKVHKIHGVGVDTRKFSEKIITRDKKREELGANNEDIILLSVGELNKNKNHEVIIRAISKLNNNNMHYYIAGEGSLEKYLIELSYSLGVGDKVHLLGYRKDIRELCTAADIFCFPSYREGLSVSLMEAMASSLPCIVSSIRGNKDLIFNGKGGYLCKANYVDGFAENINKLLENKKFCNCMGNYNSKEIINYDKKNVVEEMKKIYKETLINAQ